MEVPSAPASLKALRCASMNAQRTRGLDRRLRCGWVPVMRRMSSSHVLRTCVRAAKKSLSACRPSPGLLLQNHGIEHLLNDLLGLRVELRDGLELELEIIVGAAFVLGKK